MTQNDLLKTHEQLSEQSRAVMKAKNTDYSSSTDPFRNFRMFGTFGVLVRLSDKLARLRTFEENKEFAVADEKLEDTIIDIINYATIYLAMKQEGKSTVGRIIPCDDPSKPPVKVIDGPYCSYCDKAPKWRLEESDGPYKGNIRFFCDEHTVYLDRKDYGRCTRMETL